MDSSGIMARISGSARSRRLSPTLKSLGVLVIAHRQRHLQIFVRVQTVGINEMAFAQSAGLAQYADHLVGSRNQCISDRGIRLARQVPMPIQA